MKDFHILLDKITNSSRADVDWGLVMLLCDKTAATQDGAKLLSPILLERIRNTNERVAMHALQACEALVKNQMTLFEEVVGKYKFLNELIRLISVKYSLHTPTSVRRRILGLIQAWAYMLPQQPKISEAYEMLKRQGQNFPVISEEQSGAGNFLDYKANPKKDRFQKEEKEDELSALLKSTNPEDLKRANRLIKQLVLSESSTEKSSRKVREDIEVVKSNAELLQEMLYSITTRPEDDDVLMDLHKNCDTMAPKVKKLLDETTTDSIDFKDIESVYSLLTSALALFDRKSNEFQKNGKISASKPRGVSEDVTSLLLFDLDAPAPEESPTSARKPTSFLEDELASLGLGGSSSTQQATTSASGSTRASLLDDLLTAPISQPQPPAHGNLDLLGGFASPVAARGASPAASFTNVATLSLNIADVKPSAVAPIDVLNADGVRIQFFLTSNKVAHDVMAILVTFVNSNAFVLDKFVFQVAPPKNQQVCLLSPSQASLPAFNPIMGATSVTQLMLVNKNGSQDPLRVRYKVNFETAMGPKEYTGQVENIFPMAS